MNHNRLLQQSSIGNKLLFILDQDTNKVLRTYLSCITRTCTHWQHISKFPHSFRLLQLSFTLWLYKLQFKCSTHKGDHIVLVFPYLANYTKQNVLQIIHNFIHGFSSFIGMDIQFCVYFKPYLSHHLFTDSWCHILVNVTNIAMKIELQMSLTHKH